MSSALLQPDAANPGGGTSLSMDSSKKSVNRDNQSESERDRSSLLKRPSLFCFLPIRFAQRCYEGWDLLVQQKWGIGKFAFVNY